MRTIAVIIMINVLLSGCGTTSITASWRAKNATSRPYEKILVLGIMGDTLRNLRQVMENYLVQELRYKGIDAVSAFEDYGPKAFKKMNEVQVSKQIKNMGYDGVLTITLLSKKKEKFFVADDPSMIVDTVLFSDYYNNIHDLVYQPGYYATSTVYRWQSNLYDLRKNRAVYAVQSTSFDPINAKAEGREYSKRIVHDILKRDIIELPAKKQLTASR